MKKQSKKDKLDEKLGMKQGKKSHKQSMEDRRHESKGMTADKHGLATKMGRGK